MSKTYITLVVQVNDPDKWENDPFRKIIQDNWLNGDDSHTSQIITMCLGNEIDRMQLIEHVVEDEGGAIGDPEYQVRAIEQILALPYTNLYEQGLKVIESWKDEE